MADAGAGTGTRLLVRVEVAYARPDEQVLLVMEVERGTSVEQVIERSGIAARFPEIQKMPAWVGIFGRRTALNAIVQDGDRIEIYRPLIADPKAARRTRAGSRPGSKPRRGQG